LGGPWDGQPSLVNGPDAVAFRSNFISRLCGRIAMALEWAQWLVGACGVYLVVGAIFAIVFVSAGLQRIDVAAKEMPLSARLLVFPGLVALWPLMLTKWLSRQQPPVS
jgi:hypothetical protein